MKIGFDPVPIGGYFGNSTYTTELVRALGTAYRSDEYFVPTWFEKGRALRKCFGDGGAVRVLPIIPNPAMLGNPFKRTISKLGRRIERSRGRSTYELYHCTNPTLFNDCCDRNVLTVHDLIPLLDEPTWANPREREYYRTAIAPLFKKCGAVIVDSLSTRNAIDERFPGVSEKIRIIPLAAGAQFRPMIANPAVLRKYGVSSGMFLLSVGVYSDRKNVPLFLEAFAALPKEAREGVTVLLTGHRRKNKPFPQILDSIARNGLEKNVQIIPNIPQPDLVALYSGALAMVFPSLCEGFGLPVLEAMQCGCPVVCSNATSLPEVGGDAAHYFDPRDVASCASALQQVLGDAALQRELREKGLRRAREFSWEKTAGMTHGVYEEVYRQI